MVSQGVAASLEFEEAVKPILGCCAEHGRQFGACGARRQKLSQKYRAALPHRLVSARVQPVSMYAGLDEQVLGLARQQERVALTNLPRVRLLNFPPGSPRPESILALTITS